MYWTVCSSDDGFSKMSVCLTLFCCKKSTCFCNHSRYYCRLEREEWVTLPHWGRLHLCFWQLSRGEFHQVVDFSADLCRSGFRFCIPKWGLGIISLFVYHLGIKITFCLVKQLARGLFFFLLRNCFRLILRGIRWQWQGFRWCVVAGHCQTPISETLWRKQNRPLYRTSLSF